MKYLLISVIVTMLFSKSRSAKSALSLYSEYSPEIGFSSSKGSLATISCFIPDKITYHKRVLEPLKRPYYYQELIEALSLSQDMALPSYLFPNNELAKYLSSIKPTELTTSIIFMSAQFQNVLVGYTTSPLEAFITPHALSVLTSSQSDFHTMCGDELVESYDLGNLLIISVKLQFYTMDEHNQFGSAMKSIKPDLSPENVFNKINEIRKASNLKGTIGFSNFQIGGSEAFSSKEVTSCLLSNIDKCKTKYDEILKYLLQFYSLYEQSPLRRLPLTRFEKIALSVKCPLIQKPLSSPSDQATATQNKLLHMYDKYSYYERFLSNFQYYPIQIESIGNCLSVVKDNLRKITSSDPIKCFEDNSLCVKHEEMLSSLDGEIENKVISLLERVKTYDIITIYLKDDLFLTGEGTGNLPKFQWDAEYPVYIYLLPVDKNESRWKMVSEVFNEEYSSNVISDLNKIEFTVNEGFFKFKITLLRNYKNESEFKVVFNEEDKKIIKQLKVPLINQANPFYFGKFIENIH